MADIFGIGGNQKDARVGPFVMPTSLGTLITFAEPLLVRSLVLANTTVNPIVVTVYLVPVGATAGATNLLIPGVTVPPNDTLTYGFGDDGIPVILNDRLQHQAGATGLNIIAVVSRRNR